MSRSAIPQHSLAVVGVDFPNTDKSRSNRRFEIALCVPGEPVELRPEPKNKFDERAVGVFGARGTQLGYLPAERSGRFARLIREGREVRAVFQAPSAFGAWIRVAFDGELPVLPEPRAADELVGAGDDGVDDFYPDEVWPDE